MRGVHYISIGHKSPTGYGNAASGYMRALKEAGVSVRWTPMREGRSWGNYFEPDPASGIVPEGHAYDTVLVHLVPEFFDRWRTEEPGKKMIGVTVWESERLPDHWPAILNRMDGLIVPCKWNRDAFVRSGVVRPIHVAPHLYFSANRSSEPQQLPVRSGDYVFYTIGTWSDRKSTAKVVESFCGAFTSRDSVVLIVKTHPVNEMGRRYGHWWWHVTRRYDTARRAMGQILKRFPDPPRVIMLDAPMSEGEMRDLHQQGDCFVSLARAEGWGLGAYEAAFHGKPVIMTRNGGQVEFLPSDLSYEVPYKLVVARPVGAIDKEAFAGVQHWAEPSLDAAVEQLRHVFNHQEEAAGKGARLKTHVESTFRAPDIAQGMIDFIGSIERAGQ
jgi:glycosyltransferase involved in cell wall biosynthesis